MSTELETPRMYTAQADEAVKTTIDALYSGKYQGRSLRSHPDAMRDLANMLWHFVTHGSTELSFESDDEQRDEEKHGLYRTEG